MKGDINKGNPTLFASGSAGRVVLPYALYVGRRSRVRSGRRRRGCSVVQQMSTILRQHGGYGEREEGRVLLRDENKIKDTRGISASS
jgi:hypothetical protein